MYRIDVTIHNTADVMYLCSSELVFAVNIIIYYIIRYLFLIRI